MLVVMMIIQYYHDGFVGDYDGAGLVGGAGDDDDVRRLLMYLVLSL